MEALFTAKKCSCIKKFDQWQRHVFVIWHRAFVIKFYCLQQLMWPQWLCNFFWKESTIRHESHCRIEQAESNFHFQDRKSKSQIIKQDDDTIHWLTGWNCDAWSIRSLPVHFFLSLSLTQCVFVVLLFK